MAPKIPARLREEAIALEREIGRAFEGVSREGGISWSEAEVIDAYGSPEERAKARTLDRDQTWHELVDDPNWWHPDVMGKFLFLDPIGFRYYLPPAMIRAARTAGGEFLCYHLGGLAKGRAARELGQLFIDQFGALSLDQAGVVARFLRFMYQIDHAHGDEVYERIWIEAHRSYWCRFDLDSSPL